MLNEIWPSVISIGCPIVAVFAGLSFLSINYYWHSCREIRLLEKHIQKNKTTKGFQEEVFPPIRLQDISYSFKPLKKFNSEYLKYSKYKHLFYSIKSYRNYYKITFPVIFLLVTIGIIINEYIIK